MDADHCGKWTPIFGGKASELQDSPPVTKCNFYLPYLHLALPLGPIPQEFRRDRLHHEIRVPIVQHCLRDPMFSHFRRTPTCDRQTASGQTHNNSKYHAGIESCR